MEALKLRRASESQAAEALKLFCKARLCKSMSCWQVVCGRFVARFAVERKQAHVVTLRDEVVGGQEVEVEGAVVHGCHHRKSEEVHKERVLATWRSPQLNQATVLSLQFVLVVRQEVQVAHVVQHQGVVLLPVQLPCSFWELG